MRLVSFDPLRTLEIAGLTRLKPEEWFRRRDEVQAADWVLFPEAWQVNPLVYGWKKRIFPSVASYHLGYDKVQMTRAFEAVRPAHVPHTLIVPATEHGIAEVLEQFAFPFVAKEIRSAMGAGVHLIEDRAAFKRYAAHNTLLYAQEYLPIHRDLRVVWVGDRVLCAYWRAAAEGQFHNNVARGGSVSFDDIPQAALELVEQVAGALGIDHAGFDVAEVDGHYYLLEFNMRFGTQALNARGIRLGAEIMRYLERCSTPREPDQPLLPRAG